MKISTKQLALATVLGAATWAIKTAGPGIPLDFAIPGAKIDFSWVPALLAVIWIGPMGGVIIGFFMSLVPVPTLFLTGFLWTPWTLAIAGYLAKNRRWSWKAALIHPLLHVPIGCAIFTWILPIFPFFAWQIVMPAILLSQYTSVIIVAIIARYFEKRQPELLATILQESKKPQPNPQ